MAEFVNKEQLDFEGSRESLLCMKEKSQAKEGSRSE